MWSELSEQRLGGRTPLGHSVWGQGFGWGDGAAGEVGAEFDRVWVLGWERALHPMGSVRCEQRCSVTEVMSGRQWMERQVGNRDQGTHKGAQKKALWWLHQEKVHEEGMT